MKPPWEKKETQAYVAQEKRQAKRPGARRQLNSGRLWHSLRDVVERTVVGSMLVDCKTGKDGPLKSYRITEKEWSALKRDANRTPPGCYPSLRLDLGRHKLLVIEEEMWDEVGREWSDTQKP